MAIPALVQSKSGSATSGSSLTVTLTTATTPGNCLVVKIGAAQSSQPSVSGVTLGGAAGNMALAKKQAQANTNSTEFVDTEIWTDQGCAGSQTAIAVTLTAAIAGLAVMVEEWSGVLSAGAVDKTVSAGNLSTSFSSGSSGTLGQANELVVACVFGENLGGTATITGPTSPWTNFGQISPSTSFAMLASYQVVSATTALTYSGTDTAGTVPAYAAVLVSLKGASFVAPPPVNINQSVMRAALW